MSGTRCFFASDLHGKADRLEKLFGAVLEERPDAVFLGGDLLPHRWSNLFQAAAHFDELYAAPVRWIRDALGVTGPRVFIILGNDDERASEELFLEGENDGLWEYIHVRKVDLGAHRVCGYAFVPPTPFLLKDWERYDVGRFSDPGCVSPEEGYRTVEVDPDEIRSATIAADLDRLLADEDMDRAVLLFHGPPYRTKLDRAALDGKMVDHVPLDVHVGSVAVKRLIEERQPLLSLHGHIHESARITGDWRDRIGRTHCFTAAHDGPELALVKFDLENLDSATRELI
jgi:Icc-related predicted phosphoesterase